MNKDTLGDRMKGYENVTRNHLIRRMPVIIRIDGKAFHTLTRGFNKPFDDVLVATMQDTMKYLCENVEGCVLGYTQSDEISLVLCDYKKLETSAWFDNNIQKICSVSASLATAAFNKFFPLNVEKYLPRNNVVQLVYYHDAAFEIGKKYVKRWLNKLGEKQFRRLLDVRRADIKGQKSVFDKNMKDETEKLDAIEDLINEVLQENQCFTLRDLAVNGNDLIEMGYEPGKHLGEILDMLLSGVINEEFENEKNCLLNIAKERLLCKSTQTL